MRDRNVKSYIKGQVNTTIEVCRKLLIELKSNSTSQRDATRYLLGSHSYDINHNFTNDQAVHRKVAYVYDKFKESDLHRWKPAHNPNSLFDHKDIIGLLKTAPSVRRTYQDIYESFRIKRPISYTTAEVVRRVKDDLEFSPLNITFLDAELFALCYVISKDKGELTPNEQQTILNRIYKEFLEYEREQREYHDLSTLWWALTILLSQHQLISFEEKTQCIAKFLTLAPVRSVISNHHKDLNSDRIKRLFITEQGIAKRAFERHQSFVTEFRSVNYCHQNALEVRHWLRLRRDPRQMPVINLIREFEDACAAIGLDWCVRWRRTEEGSNWLYTTALKTDFLNRFWKSRASAFNKASDIFSNSSIKVRNSSTIDGYVTTNRKFSRDLQSAYLSLKQFKLSIANQKRPLVIGLFGNPGSGKSYLAKRLTERIGQDTLDFTLNLANIDTSERLFEALDRFVSRELGNKTLALFIDEFDVKSNGIYMFRWLLSLLWDRTIPRSSASDFRMLELRPFVVFLAASRYETFRDFQDFCISQEGKDSKATDLLSRIDFSLDIPELTPDDRYLIINGITGNKAGRDIQALCYLAEMDDGARGIEKLLKGVDLKKKFGLDTLMPLERKSLLKAAGIVEKR